MSGRGPVSALHRQDGILSDVSLGEPIPSELVEGVPRLTRGRLRVMRYVVAPVYALLSATSVAVAIDQQGPGRPAAAIGVVALCLVAAVSSREWIHRGQRLALRRLRKGQRPTGTARRPSPARAGLRGLAAALMLLLVGYPVAVVSNDALPWPSTVIAVLFAFGAGISTARVPAWILERRWPPLEVSDNV